MTHMFLPPEGLKAVYKYLSPHELLSIGTCSTFLARKLAIDALFDQHTQEAIDCQIRFLHYCVQNPRTYMPDSAIILKALAYFPPNEQLAGRYILAQQTTGASITFSDAEFQKQLQSIDDPKLSQGLIAASILTQKGMLLTSSQRSQLLKKLKDKYTSNTPPLLSQLAPYMTKSELETTIVFLFRCKFVIPVEILIKSIQILGSNLKQAIPDLSNSILDMVLTQRWLWGDIAKSLCTLIPITTPKDCICLLHYLKTRELALNEGSYTDFLLRSRPLVRKLLSNIDTELLSEFLIPSLPIILEEWDERTLLFIKTLLPYMSAQQLKPVLEQLLPHLQHLIPPYIHNVVHLSNLLFKPLGLEHLNPLQRLIQLNTIEHKCGVALELFSLAAPNASPEQLLPAFELLHRGLNNLNNNICGLIRYAFPVFIIRLGAHTLTDMELNGILDSLLNKVHWDNQKIQTLNELLGSLSLSRRSMAITYALKDVFFKSKDKLRFNNDKKALATVAQYATSDHQILFLELFSQIHDAAIHLDLMRLLPPFHAILSSQQIAQLLTLALTNLSHPNSIHREEALETLKAINYKVSAVQRTQIHQSLHLQWDTLPHTEKIQLLIHLYPYLLEEERYISIKHIVSTAQYLKELLTFIHQIHSSIPRGKIFYVLNQILKRFNDLSVQSDSEQDELLGSLFSTLAPQIDKAQQTNLMNIILNCCERTTQPINDNEVDEVDYAEDEVGIITYTGTRNIALRASIMIPHLTRQLNTEERFALFNKLNTSVFQEYILPIHLFPHFLSASNPRNADIEKLQSLEKEHQCYIDYLVSFINTTPQIPTKDLDRQPKKALKALNTWMLQCFQTQPEVILAIHKATLDFTKGENTEEFYMLQQLISLSFISSSSVDIQLTEAVIPMPAAT